MKISVVGCGYLGAVHASSLAKLGHDVVGIDIDEAKIDLLSSGKPPFYGKVLIEATDAGIELIEEIRQRRAEWFAAELSTLSRDEHAALHAAIPVLMKLANS